MPITHEIVPKNLPLLSLGTSDINSPQEGVYPAQGSSKFEQRADVHVPTKESKMVP